jgi:preprotein translocase subunit YajC
VFARLARQSTNIIGCGLHQGLEHGKLQPFVQCWRLRRLSSSALTVLLKETSVMSLFIAAAHAAPAGAPAGASMVGQLVMIAGFIAIFYFLIWRPQSKRTKEHRAMIDSINAGNEVVFAGGLMGRIKKVEGDYAVVMLNPGNEVKIQKAAVISVLPEGTLNSL